MFSSFKPLSALGGIAIALIASCTSGPVKVPEDAKVVKAGWVNPHPKGSYAHFKAENYPKKSSVYKNQEVLARTNSGNSHLVISLSKQRGFLMNGDEVAMDYPVSTGRKSHPTPPGTYYIKEKLKDKRSNLYGKVLNADGKVVNSDADSRKAKIPPGGKFLGASMPYWMRFTNSGIGHHVGRVPRYPASHACIRGQRSVMPIVFSKVRVGTRAEVVK